MDSKEIVMELRLAQWAQAIKDRIANGESIKEFCQGKGISRTTYFYWHKKVRDAACGQLFEGQNKTALPAPGFKEVRIAGQPSPEFRHFSESNSRGEIRIEAAGLRITADSSYPVGNLTELIKGCVLSC